MELNINQDRLSKSLPCWERHQEGGRTRPLNLDNIFANLCEIKEVFEKHHLVFGLSHGTLLGIYRSGGKDVISWDDDADVFAFYEQRDAFAPAIKELEERDFYVAPSVKGVPMSYENAPWYDLHIIKQGPKGGDKVEVWFFEKIGNERIYDLPRSGRALAHPIKYYETLSTTLYRGVPFPTVNYIEMYLTMMYSADFMTPNPNKKYNHQG